MKRTSRAALAVLLVMVGLAVAAPSRALADVHTYGGDTLRTGWYADQPGLGPTAVSAADFGQLWQANVTGQVYAQPLVHEGTALIATETNDIYGLNPATGAQQWTRNLHVPWKSADLACADLAPNVGITGTPVIDPATDTAYFFAKTYASGTSGPAAWYAHAVNVATGAERAGFPVAIVGTATNAPGTQFNPTTEMQRPGLLLMNGVVYAGFGGHCDAPPYQGWVIGVSTLGSVTTLWTTVANEAGGEGSGIWQSGGGLVSDKPGSIVFATGNGTTLPAPTSGANPPATGYGEAVVRLNVQPNGSLQVGDFFIPYDADYLNGFDGDLGSGAPIALPPSYFGTPSTPNLLLEVGKEGYLYLMNADNMGGYKQGSGGGDAVVNRVGPDGGVWAKPTPWGGNGGYVYVPTASPGPAATGSSGFLHAYKYGLDGAGKPTLSLAGTSSDGFGFGSGSAVVTSDGAASGSAVVWTVWRPNSTGDNAQLRAYDPVPVNGTMQLRRSFPIGSSTKFSVPAVSDNRLLLGTRDGRVLAFGRPVNAVLTAGPLTFPTTTVGQSTTLNATFTAQQTTTVQSGSISGAEFTAGTPTPAYGTSRTPGQTFTVPITFTPTAVGNASGTFTLNTPQGIAAIALSGTGQSPNPLLTINPTAISFGGIATGATRTASVTLGNAGAQPLQLTALDAPSAPFSASGLPAAGTVIPSGGSVAVTLSFSPTSIGQFADQLVVQSTGGSIAVDLTGSAGTPAKLTVSTTTVTYPDTPAGGWVDRTFTVSNTGGTDLTITKSKPPSGGAFAALTSLAEGSRVAPGASLTLKVRFAPTAAGPFTGTWDLNGDGASTATLVTFTGNGKPNGGIPPPTEGGWTLNGAATMQGNQLVLTPAAQQLAGTSFWPTALNPSAFSVSFDLTMDQGTGADGATFAIIPSTADPLATGGKGNALGWSPLGGVAVLFDTFKNGSDPSANYVGIAHIQAGAMVVDATNITIPALRNSTRHIVITRSNGHLIVSIDGVQYLDVTITLPASARVGFTASTGTLTDRHAISNVSFTLPNIAAALSLTPQTADFGPVGVGQTSTRTLSLRNIGGSPLQITAITAPSGPFSATLPTVGSVIPAGAGVDVPVRYTPTSTTSSNGSLNVQTNGGSQTVTLSGTGTSPPAAGWRPPVLVSDGVLRSSPAVVVARDAPDREDVFVVGTDGGVWWTTGQGSAFGGWSPLGAPPVGLKDDPAAGSWSAGRLDLFVRGGDDRLWQRFSVDGGTTWSGWFKPFGNDGVLASAPEVSSRGPQRLDVFVTGTDGLVYQRFYEPSGWYAGWLPMLGPVSHAQGRPAAVSWDGVRVDIFVRGGDNRLWQRFWDGSGWSGWIQPPGTAAGLLASAPDVASWGPGALSLVTRGSDGGLHITSYPSGGLWSSWQRVGGAGDVLQGSPAIAARTAGSLDVVVRGTDDRPYVFRYGP